MNARTFTPDRVEITEDGRKVTHITTKRCCNGCGQYVGDVTDAEMAAAIGGRPLPDVRRECPACSPTAPEPACYPLAILAGDSLCVELECDHDLADGADHCEDVREETVCGTHSRAEKKDWFEEIVRAEPWPCKYSQAVAS